MKNYGFIFSVWKTIFEDTFPQCIVKNFQPIYFDIVKISYLCTPF